MGPVMTASPDTVTRIVRGVRVAHLDGRRTGTVQNVNTHLPPPTAEVAWDQGGKPEWLAMGWLEVIPDTAEAKGA